MRTRSVCRLQRLRSIQRRFRGVCLRPALQRVGDKPAKWMRKRCGVRKDQSIRLYRQFYDGDFTEASGFSPLLRVLQVSLWPTPGEGVAIRVAVRPTLVEGVAIRVAPRRTGITTGRTGGASRGTVRGGAPRIATPSTSVGR